MKRISTIIIVAVATLAFSSCEDFLDKGPKLDQSTDLTLSTYAGLNKSTAGAYEYLSNTIWYGGEKILESEMRCGNGAKDIKHNSNRYATQYNWNYSSDATSSLWAAGYYTISYANNVIDNLEGKDVDGVTKQDLDNLKAECLFLRALSHFDICNLYSQAYMKNPEGPGVPVVLHTDPAGKPKRETIKTVYEQVVADLVEAESIIDPGYVREGVADKKAAVTKEAIQALLSRVYLYMGKWQEAADYATKVINSGKFELYTVDNYKSAWTQATGGSEVIFEVYIDMTNLSNENPSYMTFPDGAYGDCLASAELVSIYADDDVRKSCYVQDKDKSAGLWWTTKYAGKGLNSPDANNTVVLRLSEMYLNRAEALAQGAKVSGCEALYDLQTIAEARGTTVSNETSNLAKAKVERRKELAWEGHHFFDKARWNEAVVRKPDAYLTETYATIPADSYKWALPIPKREIEINENLEQNAEY